MRQTPNVRSAPRAAVPTRSLLDPEQTSHGGQSIGAYVIMAPSVSTGDGGRNVAGEYLVAEPLDYFHFAEAPDWVYGLVLQPDPKQDLLPR